MQNKKKFVEKNQGQDKIVGRPIRLNKVSLAPQSNKDYADLVLIGDVHYGADNCDLKRFLSMLDDCLDNKRHVHLMGDLLESANRYSVGAGVYEQLRPQRQMDDMIGFLRPLADAGLITGTHMGNHCERIYKETGINIMSIMARELGVKYLGSAMWNQITVGNQKYLMYSLHGASGSRYVYTKLKALVDISHNFDADILAMAHVHDLAETSILVQKVNNRNNINWSRLTNLKLKYQIGRAQV
jgi:UDP-2,3-diacylglucosamine pyrophosphatase LpxH